ncbi:SDR family NAD(P)-dependent oxidoreductase [Mycobacterium sp. TNTM28]|uniref:SDR family NAD(P)-dependent oxidoreductase n=1 Tax=[Mycobacterium] fortunisiensis TaxID=2600579 RepID=A0ABS6KIU1_9MYCO|nr:SDR family NAD(P)-dependent oxidoreductase [[Mycobacterium] fortunisiensis]MBU9763433.1 SDR family NAD(P)-dependent oxidoreductase [[Mycobacterium] fortunisiensis]
MTSPDKAPDLSAAAAVVTGGASGIGFALANAYGRRGATVVIVDRDELAELARAAGG